MDKLKKACEQLTNEWVEEVPIVEPDIKEPPQIVKDKISAAPSSPIAEACKEMTEDWVEKVDSDTEETPKISEETAEETKNIPSKAAKKGKTATLTALVINVILNVILLTGIIAMAYTPQAEYTFDYTGHSYNYKITARNTGNHTNLKVKTAKIEGLVSDEKINEENKSPYTKLTFADDTYFNIQKLHINTEILRDSDCSVCCKNISGIDYIFIKSNELPNSGEYEVLWNDGKYVFNITTNCNDEEKILKVITKLR